MTMETAAFLLYIALTGPVGFAADPLAEAQDLYLHAKYERVVEILSSGGPPASAGACFLLGKTYYRLHKTNEAIRQLEKAVELERSNSDYHAWLGMAYLQKGTSVSFFAALAWAGKVEREFEAAVKVDPENLDARFDLLEYYLQAPRLVGGGRDKAMAQAQAIAAISSQQGYSARSRVFKHDKQFDTAKLELTKSTEQFPSNPDAHTDLGEFLLDQCDYAGAESSARKALELQPDNLNAKLILNAALVALGKDVASAEEALAQMSRGPLRDEIDPMFDEVHYWLGRAYEKQGNMSQARQAYQTALRFEPDNAAAKSALAQLR
jgi:cytochrome c-type biogenesis protein CcmH/NrfG